MADWIQTFSGRIFYPLAPRKADVCFDDIAHALSCMCRYAGHTREFYSVAQHSVIVAAMVPAEDQLAALMHDAPEAYLGELTRPVKMDLPDYKAAEEKVLAVIMEVFGIADIPDIVLEADRRILVAERDDLMATAPLPWKYLEGLDRPFPQRIRPWLPNRAEDVFQHAFRRLVMGRPLDLEEVLL